MCHATEPHPPPRPPTFEVLLHNHNGSFLSSSRETAESLAFYEQDFGFLRSCRNILIFSPRDIATGQTGQMMLLLHFTNEKEGTEGRGTSVRSPSWPDWQRAAESAPHAQRGFLWPNDSAVIPLAGICAVTCQAHSASAWCSYLCVCPGCYVRRRSALCTCPLAPCMFPGPIPPCDCRRDLQLAFTCLIMPRSSAPHFPRTSLVRKAALMSETGP